jgi:serine/threonine protein kinase
MSTDPALGSYRIESILGEGGMGVVYKAHDPNLRRFVALKVIRSASITTEQRARFLQEARAASALNHPHIAQIYDLVRTPDQDVIVMEYVEGDTLDRLVGRGLPLRDALRYGAQIADALAAAHTAGIVHRDLKPRNIVITADSRTRERVAKLLDFGVAKLTQPAPEIMQATTTIGLPETLEGTLIGTVPYMSPEQAEGKPVDSRSDVFSFGGLLYELVTGRRAFERETNLATLTAILHEEPEPVHNLVSGAPPELDRLIVRCLRKDPRRRFQVMDDVKIVLEEIIQGTSGDAVTVADGQRWRRMGAVALGAALAAATLGALYAATRPAQFDTSALRYSPLAAEPGPQTYPSWSPDGKSIAYLREVNGTRQIFARSLDLSVPTQVTSSPVQRDSPFWSPDGRRIFHLAQGDLWSVSAAGGEPQLILEDVAAATISPDGRTLAFLRGASPNRSLWVTPIDRLDPRRYETAPFPATFTFSRSLEFSSDGAQIAVLIEPRRDDAAANELWIVPYPVGRPRRVPGAAPYFSGDAGGRISWIDNRHIAIDGQSPNGHGSHLSMIDVGSGTIWPLTSGTNEEWSPSAAPDGRRLAFVSGSEDSNLIQISLETLAAESLLATSRDERFPTWAPDGGRIAYTTNTRGGPEIWVRNLREGSAAPIVTRDSSGLGEWQNVSRPSVSPDGQRIAYDVVGATHGVWVSPIAGGRGVPLDSASSDQHSPSWSPDGRWIAYQRRFQGEWEIVKTPAGGGTPVRLAEGNPGGGPQTAWSPSGDWIAYVRLGRLRVVSVDGNSDKEMMASPTPAFGFSADGARLYVIRRTSGRWELVSLDVATDKQLRVAPLPVPSEATFTGFSLHPDGNSFATAVDLRRFDLWLLEGLEPPERWLGSLFQ